MIDMLAFGIIIPVLPHLIVDLVGGSIAKAAVWTSAFGTLFMLMQFVFSPIQGALSDRFGRRPVILISSFGLGVDFVVMALAPVLWLLFVGRIVSGICAASFTTANAYIADVTPPEKRAAALRHARRARSASASSSARRSAASSATSTSACRSGSRPRLSLLNFCYGYFVLPESLPKERRSARFDWRHANPLGSLLLLRRYPQVFGAGRGVLPDRIWRSTRSIRPTCCTPTTATAGDRRWSATRWRWSACAAAWCRRCWCGG